MMHVIIDRQIAYVWNWSWPDSNNLVQIKFSDT